MKHHADLGIVQRNLRAHPETDGEDLLRILQDPAWHLEWVGLEAC
jgi:hypothetical protein